MLSFLMNFGLGATAAAMVGPTILEIATSKPKTAALAAITAVLAGVGFKKKDEIKRMLDALSEKIKKGPPYEEL